MYDRGMDTLIERRTLYRVRYVDADGNTTGVDHDSVYEACLLCDNEAERNMLCGKCWKNAVNCGDSWKYPGSYLDDYSTEGEELLDSFVDWLIQYNCHEFIKMIETLGGEIEFVPGPGEAKVGFGGYDWKYDEYGCAYCARMGRKHKGRGLCETCYRTLLDKGTLEQYPTGRYINNVDGHAWWMLTYHPARVTAIAQFYGLKLNLSPTINP